jgi:hypothetical protein
MSDRPAEKHVAVKPSICFVALKNYAVLSTIDPVND